MNACAVKQYRIVINSCWKPCCHFCVQLLKSYLENGSRTLRPKTFTAHKSRPARLISFCLKRSQFDLIDILDTHVCTWVHWRWIWAACTQTRNVLLFHLSYRVFVTAFVSLFEGAVLVNKRIPDHPDPLWLLFRKYCSRCSKSLCFQTYLRYFPI